MKNKFLVLALIAVALTAGLVLAGCSHPDCPGGGSVDAGKCKAGLTSLGDKQCENYCLRTTLDNKRCNC